MKENERTSVKIAIGVVIKFWKIVRGKEQRNWKGDSQARSDRKETIKIEYILQKIRNFSMININNIQYKI